MLKAKIFLFVYGLSTIITTASFTLAADTPNDNASDFIRVYQALEDEHVSDKFRMSINNQKLATLVCPSGQAQELLVGNMAFSKRELIKVSADRFDIPLSKRQETVFLSCKEQEESVWYKYVLATCSKSKKGCFSGPITMVKDSTLRESTVSKDGRFYAKVSVSDINLLFCPDKKPVKVIGLTQRDNMLIKVQNVGTDGFGLLFFSKTNSDRPGTIYYPLEYAHLKFDVQCGDDPIRELWVKPVRIPGRMLELK